MTKKITHWPRVLSLLFLSLVAIFVLSVSLGSVAIPIEEVIKVITGRAASNNAWATIIWEFRLPKALTAVFAGAALSVSGLMMQTFFRNPLAGPFVLGISSGASLGVALLVLAGGLMGFGLSWESAAGPWMVVWAAIIGASLVMGLVLLVSIRIPDPMTLLIVGLMFGSVTSAVVSVLQYFSDAAEIQAYLVWTFGSLGKLSWYQWKVFAPLILLGLSICLLLAKPLNALLLGEAYAQSMGISIKWVRVGIILSTSLLAGAVTAFCGPIAFIGIAVPHLTRALLPISDHRKLFPAVAFAGAIILLLCDIAAQLPGSVQTLPLNAVTSLIGAPVVIWVILRRRNLQYSLPR